METKLSFGFTKTSKKPQLQFKKPEVEEEKKELIDCLEGQSIKVKDAKEEVKEQLVIPVQNSGESLVERIIKAQEKSKKNEIKEDVKEKPDSELTIDELAARELIKEAQNRDGLTTETTKVHTLPLTEDNLQFEGKEESTLEDYENIPVNEYGLAMLRGMGWNEGMTLGKNPSKIVKTDVPEMRPKGLGLGANKIVTVQNKTLDKDGKELLLVKGAYAKIIAGGHKGKYCKVEGLDDENCRIVVKTAITNEVLTLNEFLLMPVTQKEYDLGSKVINNAKYEEFKELSDRKLSKQNNLKKEKHSDSEGEDNRKEEYSDSASKDQRQRKIKKEKVSDSESEYDKKTKGRKRAEKYLDSDDERSRKIKKERRSDSESEDNEKSRKDRGRDKYSNSSSEERKKKKKSKHKSKQGRHSLSEEEESRRYKKEKSKSKYKNNDSDRDRKKHKSKRKY